MVPKPSRANTTPSAFALSARRSTNLNLPVIAFGSSWEVFVCSTNSRHLVSAYLIFSLAACSAGSDALPPSDCESASECPSGICLDGECVPPEPDSGVQDAMPSMDAMPSLPDADPSDASSADASEPDASLPDASAPDAEPMPTFEDDADGDGISDYHEGRFLPTGAPDSDGDGTPDYWIRTVTRTGSPTPGRPEIPMFSPRLEIATATASPISKTRTVMTMASLTGSKEQTIPTATVEKTTGTSITTTTAYGTLSRSDPTPPCREILTWTVHRTTATRTATGIQSSTPLKRSWTPTRTP